MARRRDSLVTMSRTHPPSRRASFVTASPLTPTVTPRSRRHPTPGVTPWSRRHHSLPLSRLGHALTPDARRVPMRGHSRCPPSPDTRSLPIRAQSRHALTPDARRVPMRGHSRCAPSPDTRPVPARAHSRCAPSPEGISLKEGNFFNFLTLRLKAKYLSPKYLMPSH